MEARWKVRSGAAPAINEFKERMSKRYNEKEKEATVKPKKIRITRNIR